MKNRRGRPYKMLNLSSELTVRIRDIVALEEVRDARYIPPRFEHINVYVSTGTTFQTTIPLSVLLHDIETVDEPR